MSGPETKTDEKSVVTPQQLLQLVKNGNYPQACELIQQLDPREAYNAANSCLQAQENLPPPAKILIIALAKYCHQGATQPNANLLVRLCQGGLVSDLAKKIETIDDLLLIHAITILLNKPNQENSNDAENNINNQIIIQVGCILTKIPNENEPKSEVNTLTSRQTLFSCLDIFAQLKMLSQERALNTNTHSDKLFLLLHFIAALTKATTTQEINALQKDEEYQPLHEHRYWLFDLVCWALKCCLCCFISEHRLRWETSTGKLADELCEARKAKLAP
jgi:hypothetical protein